MQGVQVRGVVGGKGMLGRAGCYEGEVAGGGLGVVGAGAGEAALHPYVPRLLRLGGFIGCDGGVGRRIIGGGEEGVCEEGRRGGVVGHAGGAAREGVAGDGDVGVGGAAAFGGDDVGVVGGGDFVDDADEAVGPGEFGLVVVAGGEEWGFFIIGRVRGCGEVGLDGGEWRRGGR